MIRFEIPAKRLKQFGVVALAFLAMAGSYFQLFELYELQTYDWRYKIRGSRPTSPDIAIIEIEDNTLKGFGGWPFSREYYAYLINVLSEYGAKAVFFDVLFVEPSDSDKEMAEAIKAAGNVYFPVAYDSPDSRGGLLHSQETQAPLLAAYEKEAKGVGYVNVWTDRDGKRRRLPLTVDYNGKRSEYIGLKLAADLLKVPVSDISVVPGREVRIGSLRRVPLDEDGLCQINYAGRWVETFRHFSFYEILYSYKQIHELNEKPYVDLNVLKDKICIIGATATGTYDVNASPLEKVYPNVGIHANAVNSILMNDFVRRAHRSVNLVLFFILAALTVLASSRLRPWRAFFVTAEIAAVYSTAAIVLFWKWGIWIDLFYPLLMVILIYSATTLQKTLREMRKRELIESELKVASQIQKSFLPETVPQIPGLDIGIFMRPAKAVGGDLYTFMEPGEGRIGVMVGDVSGKGTPAALFMAKAVSEFKFSAREKQDVSQVMAALNHSIASESTGGLFVTVAYGIFDLRRHVLELSNGGHLPVVRVDAQGNSFLIAADGGMPIGVMDGAEFSSVSQDVSPGDCYAFYSDGISEARNRKKDEYGVERLQKIITMFRSLPAKEILNRTMEDLEKFTAKAEQHDDMTLIIVKVSE